MAGKGPTLTRRIAAAGVAIAATTAGITMTNTSSSPRQPVAYVPHGGGPWPFVDVDFGAKHEEAALRSYLESLALIPATPPRAVLCISAHWEEAVPTVMTSAAPPMLYDYSGFPEASYRITWPAPGHAEVAARARALLEKRGFQTRDDDSRGFDHGTFVPLKLAYPKADVPTVQLSLIRGLDPSAHVAMGRALAPLRDEGVFIVGSGMSYHNLLGLFAGSGGADSQRFDNWLQETMRLTGVERTARLLAWASAPAARASHPREEHLIPLLVCAGAAEGEPATVPFVGSYAGVTLSAYHFA